VSGLAAASRTDMAFARASESGALKLRCAYDVGPDVIRAT
jgi:hypothetical protein